MRQCDKGSTEVCHGNSEWYRYSGLSTSWSLSTLTFQFHPKQDWFLLWVYLLYPEEFLSGLLLKELGLSSALLSLGNGKPAELLRCMSLPHTVPRTAPAFSRPFKFILDSVSTQYSCLLTSVKAEILMLGTQETRPMKGKWSKRKRREHREHMKTVWDC